MGDIRLDANQPRRSGRAVFTSAVTLFTPLAPATWDQKSYQSYACNPWAGLDNYLLLAHVVPARSATWLANPGWNRRWLILHHVLIDQPLPLLSHAHLGISTIIKSVKTGKAHTLIFSCWWYRHSLSKANTKSPHLKRRKQTGAHCNHCKLLS